MAMPDHDSVIQDFKEWIKESTCYSVGNLASDERRPFVPLKAVEAYLEGNQNRRLNNILTALYQPNDPPTYAEAILKRYTAVICILLEIGKGNLIHLFTEHDTLRDCYLPFHPDALPSYFPTDTNGNQIYKDFCQVQWKYAVPVFNRLLNHTFHPGEVLPIDSRNVLADHIGAYASLWKITLHKDYNHLQPQSIESNRLTNANTFILKSYHSDNKSAVDLYEAEVKTLRRLTPDQSIVGFCGNYVHGSTSNVILEYADRGNLDQYFEDVDPPSTGEDIIQLWRRLFGIIRALVAIYKVPWDTLPCEPQLGRRWHPDVKPSNILVASDSAPTPYQCKFQLADFSLSQFTTSKYPADGEIYGTSSYRAPPYKRGLDAASPQVVKQSDDIWSLGCVFSEAATWIATGYQGLLTYRHQRKTEINAECSPAPTNSFHDGGGLLNIVQEHHRRLLNMLRHQDFITQSVIDSMVEEMLEIPEGRPTADQLWIKSQRILERAENRYAALADNTSEQSKNTIVRPMSTPRNPISTYGHVANNVTNIEISELRPTFVESMPHPPRSSPLLNKDKNVAAESVEGHVHYQGSTSAGHFPNHQGFPGAKYVNSPLSFDISNTAHTADSTASGTSTISTSSNADSDAYPEPYPTPLTPRLLISDSEEFASSPEQEYESQLRSRRDSPRRVRIDSRRVSEANLSVSEAQGWKVRKKTGRAAPLFDEPSLQQLGKRDHVFIIDDAASMASHWEEVRNVLEVLSYILKVDPEGVDLYFTNSPEHLKARSTTKLLRFLDQHRPNERNIKLLTDINPCLGTVVKMHMKRMRSWEKATSISKLGPSKRPRPITVYVLTDGMWRGNLDMDHCLSTLTRNLVELEMDDPHSGVQFISFGDAFGKERLAQMDAELSVDNFDVTPSTGNVRKMLFGVGSDKFDRRERRSRMRATAVRGSTVMKNGLRRMSTTLSLKSSSSKHETDRVDSIVTDLPKPRPQRPATGIMEWRGTGLPPPSIDFLFIHGLDGDREKDWHACEQVGSTSFNWPQALRSSHFPNARLLSYGFDSKSWYSYQIKDVITAQSRDLLKSLSKIRSGPPEQAERPIVIIAQGVGGLIAKSALLQSHLAFGSDTRIEKGIKLSTTGIILLEPLDSQISGDTVVPAVFESHRSANPDKNPRKSTAQDATWLKLQLDSFQSISNSFSIYSFHCCGHGAHQPHVPFVPSTKSPSIQFGDVPPQISSSRGQLHEEPAHITDDSEATLTTAINTTLEVERIHDFKGLLDPDYRAIERALDALSKEAAQRSKANWKIYESERISAETRDMVFNKSELIRMFPTRNHQFTGRYSDLDSIHSALFGDDKGKQSRLFSSTVEIYGPGGIGKTQLALEFIHRYKQKFTTILWIDSQSHSSVQKSLCKMERTLSRNRISRAEATQASRVNISESSGSTSSGDSMGSLIQPQKVEPQGLPSYSTDIVKAWLARENNNQWIMVFDGADDENKSWIQEFLPKTKNGHVLITSRHQDLLKYSTSIRLGPMQEEDAKKLFLYSCPDNDEKSALQLVKRLDCVPLAIIQAGGYIASAGMTASDYLSRFKEARPRVWADYAKRMNLIFTTSVDEVFEKAYKETKAKDHDALNLLTLCSFMAAESIPGVVLEVGSNRSGRRLDDMVDTLYNNGFGHREENLQSFRMHSLVQSWIRQRLSTEKQALLVAKALTTFAIVVESERSGINDSRGFQGLEKLLLGHITACLSRVEEIKHCDVKWCVLGDVCKQQKRYGEAVVLYQKGLSDPDIAKHKTCSQRQYLRFELGSVYQLQGKLNDAVEEYEATIRECDADPPDEDSRYIRGQLLLDIYKALSSVYSRIGRTARSETVLTEGINRLEALFGSNSFQTLQLLDVCVTEYYDQEDYEQAEALCRWIVSAQIQTLGIDHPRTMHANEKLARVYFQRGKFHDAEPLSRQCLAGCEKSLGLEHPTTLNQVLFLGRISTKLHKFTEAEALLQRAVKGYEKILGPQHPESSNAREELAMCFEVQDKLKEAHAVYMQVMFGREDAKDPRIRETLKRMLPLMERLGMQREARQLLVQYSDGFRTV